MSHQQIIQTLIEWIDEHIDQPLNIDVVAKKSGYSKWYLQRMFRTVMHQTLVITFASAGSCWRRRRYAQRSGPFLISQWIWAMCRSRPFPASSAASLTVRRATTAISSINAC